MIITIDFTNYVYTIQVGTDFSYKRLPLLKFIMGKAVYEYQCVLIYYWLCVLWNYFTLCIMLSILLNQFF